MAEDEPVVLIDEREVVDDEFVKRIKVIAVPESAKFPDGIKYRMHYGRLDGTTLLRYDNSHGVHERHTRDGVEEVAFPGVEARFRQFMEEIDD